MSEVFTIEIHPCIRVVGVLLPQGHDLLWRREAHLYMVTPKEWPIHEGFRNRIQEDGRISLHGEFNIRRGKLIREDKVKAFRQVNWYFIRVQEVFWKDLFERGIIFSMVSHWLNPEICATPTMLIPKLEMRLHVPKGMLTSVPEPEPENNPLILNLWEHAAVYFPGEPEVPDAYDEFVLGEICEYDYIDRGHLPRGSNVPFLLSFETVREAIMSILRT